MNVVYRVGSGTTPLQEHTEAKRILHTVQLHDGVMGHHVARNLDKRGYGFEPAGLEQAAQIECIRDEKLELIEELYVATQDSLAVGSRRLGDVPPL